MAIQLNGFSQGGISGVKFGRLSIPDPSFSSVSLLLHYDAPNGTTTVVDSSSFNKPVTNVTNVATISTTQSKFGGSSMLFTGTNSYLRVPYSVTNLNYSLQTWTVECWFWANSFATDGTLISADTYGHSYDFSIRLVNATTIASHTAGTSVNLTSTVPAMTAGTWYHLAAVRNAGVLKHYLNGVAYGSSSMGITNVSGAYTSIGCQSWNNPNAFFNGYMDDLRFTWGVARYTANFTPPTAAFPNS